MDSLPLFYPKVSKTGFCLLMAYNINNLVSEVQSVGTSSYVFITRTKENQALFRSSKGLGGHLTPGLPNILCFAFHGDLGTTEMLGANEAK